MMISEMMAGGMLIHDVHNHMFRNHYHKKYLHIRSENDPNYHAEDEDINGNEMIQSHIRITENPLPPPPMVNAADRSEDYIR